MQNTNDKKEEDVTTVKREDYQYTPKEGFVLTHFLTVADVKRSTDFYLRILGGKVHARYFTSCAAEIAKL